MTPKFKVGNLVIESPEYRCADEEIVVGIVIAVGDVKVAVFDGFDFKKEAEKPTPRDVSYVSYQRKTIYKVHWMKASPPRPGDFDDDSENIRSHYGWELAKATKELCQALQNSK